MGFYGHGFGVGRRMAKRLHDQIGRKAQTSQVFEFVASHGARGVLAAHRRHAGFAISIGANALAFGQAAGASRSEEHTSELQSLMRISYAVFCLKNKTKQENDRIIRRCNNTNKNTERET